MPLSILGERRRRMVDRWHMPGAWDLNEPKGACSLRMLVKISCFRGQQTPTSLKKVNLGIICVSVCVFLPGMCNSVSELYAFDQIWILLVIENSK